jgi:hypothetical protein
VLAPLSRDGLEKQHVMTDAKTFLTESGQLDPYSISSLAFPDKHYAKLIKVNEFNNNLDKISNSLNKFNE